MSRPRELGARPTCDRCNKPVEHFIEVWDEGMARMVYVARCHGESERVIIERHVVEAGRWGRGRLRLKRRKRLPAGESVYLSAKVSTSRVAFSRSVPN